MYSCSVLYLNLPIRPGLVYEVPTSLEGVYNLTVLVKHKILFEKRKSLLPIVLSVTPPSLSDFDLVNPDDIPQAYSLLFFEFNFSIVSSHPKLRR